MGESRTVSTARLVAAVTTGLAATALLASCAGLGAAPGEDASATGTPSAVASSAEATATPAPTASVTPEATATPAATEAPAVETPSATPAAAEKVAVVPFITSATWDAGSKRLDVSAIVPEVVEPTGRCTVTAVQGDATASASGPAVPAASYTGCSQLAITGADLSAGTWQVRVSYSSDESAGTSAVRTVTVG